MRTSSRRKIPAGVARQVITRRLPFLHVVVADGGVARILRESRADEGRTGRRGAVLEEVLRLENPASRQPSRALVSDRTGRVFDSGSRTGSGPPSRARHGAQSDYDPHTVELQRFARRLAALLDVECRMGHVEELVVIAGPKFMGVLRPLLPARVGKRVSREIVRDLVRSSDAAIRKAAFAQRLD